ncbi:MAG: DUF47 family protein [Thermoleophilia bacterium]|nr:DUF47 family protein [Thermoleophilia bacterium]
MAKARRKTMRQSAASALDEAIGVLGKGTETQVLGHLAEFADQVVVITEKLVAVVERFADDRYDELAEAAHELDLLESAADDTKEAILDRLALGSVFPMGRADLARLVASIDAIANLAAGAADRISMRRFTLPASMNEKLVELARIDLEAVRTLRDAVVAIGADLRVVIRLAREVDKIESRADEVFSKLYQGMFEIETDYKTFHQLKSIIERLENVADRCCENAELLRHMALEYLESE